MIQAQRETLAQITEISTRLHVATVLLIQYARVPSSSGPPETCYQHVEVFQENHNPQFSGQLTYRRVIPIVLILYKSPCVIKIKYYYCLVN